MLCLTYEENNVKNSSGSVLCGVCIEEDVPLFVLNDHDHSGTLVFLVLTVCAYSVRTTVGSHV